MPKRDLAIGMFDSGLGGLTVLKQLSKHLPHEKIIYFGDTARMPYGDKSSQEILRYSKENADFLMRKNAIKLLIVACNTAAAHSSKQLKEHCSIPVIDVVEAGVESIVKATKRQRIGVIGTRGTIGSGIYENEIKKLLPDATVISIACPLLAPLVEEQFTYHPATKLIIKEYLTPLRSAGIDALLLGCTHYPLLRHLIEDELGSDIAIVDSSVSCSEKVAKLLLEHDLESSKLNSADKYQFFVSDDPDRFSRSARNFLEGHIDVHIQLKHHD